MVNLNTLEKSLLEGRRKQLRSGLLRVAKALGDKSLGASKVSKIKTKTQWVAALNGLENRIIKKSLNSSIPLSKTERAKSLIRSLKPKWNQIN